MNKVIILTLLALTSCITPKNWSQNAHESQMLMCSSACNESGNKMSSYSPLTGKCVCRSK